jgi:hypothetical protein
MAPTWGVFLAFAVRQVVARVGALPVHAQHITGVGQIPSNRARESGGDRYAGSSSRQYRLAQTREERRPFPPNDLARSPDFI